MVMHTNVKNGQSDDYAHTVRRFEMPVFQGKLRLAAAKHGLRGSRSPQGASTPCSPAPVPVGRGPLICSYQERF